MCTLCDVTKAVQVIGNLIFFFTIWNLTANTYIATKIKSGKVADESVTEDWFPSK